jgi:hypothetical protein
VLAGGEKGSLGKTLVGGDEQAAFEVFRIQTDRPAGVYHVVDCIRTDQVFPNPAVITAVDPRRSPALRHGDVPGGHPRKRDTRLRCL